MNNSKDKYVPKLSGPIEQAMTGLNRRNQTSILVKSTVLCCCEKYGSSTKLRLVNAETIHFFRIHVNCTSHSSYLTKWMPGSHSLNFLNLLIAELESSLVQVLMNYGAHLRS